MNSKQECIAKAYGEYYDLVKDNLTENGFTGSYPYHGEGKDLFIKISHIAKKENWDNNQFHYRPKSLQGIENNNGWIKIESEESLPTKEGKYIWGRLHKESEYGPEWFEQFKETTKEGIIKAYKFYIRVTHYKEVFDHEPPLH